MKMIEIKHPWECLYVVFATVGNVSLQEHAFVGDAGMEPGEILDKFAQDVYGVESYDNVPQPNPRALGPIIRGSHAIVALTRKELLDTTCTIDWAGTTVDNGVRKKSDAIVGTTTTAEVNLSDVGVFYVFAHTHEENHTLGWDKKPFDENHVIRCVAIVKSKDELLEVVFDYEQ